MTGGPTITGRAVVAGVVGWPVAQSLSPVLHNAWIAALGLDAAYVPFAVRPDGFDRWLDGLREGGVRGLNVTMPFKARALAAADRATAAARRAGGANTLVFEADDALSADSTDGRGVLAAFAEQAPAWRAATRPVVVYGAGGAAGGAIEALLDAGAPQVRVVARDPDKARELTQALGPAARVYAWPDAEAALAEASAVINATSLGFQERDPLELPWAAAPPDAVVMDMVMSPLQTPLLRAARARGHATVDGLAMLIGQARPSFEAFFGVPPPAGVDVRGLALAAIAVREARA